MLWRFGTILTAVLAVQLAGAAQTTVAVAQELELSLPIDCKLGQDCFIQNYVDIDPGPGVQTATCAQAGYDGHKGTDFRVLSTNQSANIIAAAPGVVTGVRNDMPDRLVQSAEDRKLIEGKECGNGVVVSHGNGWETQYCHLRQGSVTVARGDSIRRGDILGEVGYSGFAAFPHVHLSLRKDGQVVDPFLGHPEASEDRLAQCESVSDAHKAYDASLWLGDLVALLKDADGEIIQTGFADRAVKSIDLETGSETEPGAQSPVFVYFARLINLKKGDRVALRLVGPEGVMAESEGEILDRQKAQWVAFAGRKLRAEAWPTGEYVGTAMLIRDGQIYRQEKSVFSLGAR